jgi:hypothetical protein
MDVHLKRLPKVTYWGVVGIVFLAGVILEYVDRNGSLTTFMAHALLVLLAAGAVIRLTRPGSVVLKLFLIVFLFVVVFSTLT